MTHRRPVGLLLVAAGLWGLAVTGTKYALGGFPPVTLLAIELVVASIALWISLLVKGYRRPASWQTAAVLGLLEPGLAYLCETFGLTGTSAGNASLIGGLESSFVILLAALVLRERLTVVLAVTMGAGLIGLFTIEQASWSSGPAIGDAFVLFGTLSAAAYTIVAVRLNVEEDSLAVTAYQFAAATLAVLPAAVVAWGSGAEALPTQVAPRFWLVAIGVGLGGYALSFLLYNRATASVDARQAAVVINVIPACGLISAVLVLGEALTPGRVLGATLVIGSVMYYTLRTGPGGEPRSEAAEPESVVGYLPVVQPFVVGPSTPVGSRAFPALNAEN